MRDVFRKNPLPGPDANQQGRDTATEALMEEWYKNEQEENFASVKGMFRPRRTGSWRAVWIALFIFFIIVGFGVFAVYWIIEGRTIPLQDPAGAESEILEVAFSSPEYADSGDTVSLTLTYTNTGKSHLTDVVAAVIYPDNFIFLESAPIAPENFDKNYWRIPSIPPNVSGKLEITGQLLGVQDEVKQFDAVVMYKAANFHSTFRASALQKIIIRQSVLAVEIFGPENLISNQEVRYVISVLNIAGTALKNVRVRLVYPEELALSSPLPDTVEKVWRTSELLPGEKKEIAIAGVLPGKSGDLKEFKAQAGIERDGKFVLQNQAALVASVIEPIIEIEANFGSSSTVHFGEPFETSIHIGNASTLILDRGILEVTISDPENVIIWDTFKTDPLYRYEVVSEKNDGVKGSRIARFSEIGIIAPADEIYITFSVSLIDVPYDLETNDFYIELTPHFQAGSEGVTALLEVTGTRVRADVVNVGN
ncbi:MAG: hypothetical protein A3H07_01550 [Candidatus Jacksonbacteria bacterium RIFCSPLOWO2_12_FULL_44_15b]|nr:MAG: hypothetical protein A3H07_01550 [Candidatus Jacksonbacteria bacterium RIFCSPLOWO2_12_FULL_44_15b]